MRFQAMGLTEFINLYRAPTPALPSPFHEAPHTMDSCASRAMTLLAPTSHTATTQSFPDVRRYLPLGDHAMSTTLSVWPFFALLSAAAASASASAAEVLQLGPGAALEEGHVALAPGDGEHGAVGSPRCSGTS